MSAPNNDANFGGLTTPILIADNIQVVGGRASSSDGLASLTKVGTSPAAIALEIQSTTGGAVVPRMTTAERDAQAGFWLDGTLIYVTDGLMAGFQFRELGLWIPLPAAGIGDVTFVPPVPTAVGNIPVFDDLTGLLIKDSTVNITGGVSSVIANANPVVGNQFSNISIIEFVTADSTGLFPDCGLAVEFLGDSSTVYLARICRHDTSGPFATMVFSNSLTGVTSTSPAAILEIESPSGGPPSAFLNSRIQFADLTTDLNFDGMQFYQSTADTTGQLRPARMLFHQRGNLQAFNAQYGAQCWGETIVQGLITTPVTYNVNSTSDCVIACIVAGVTPGTIQINLPFDKNAQGGIYVVTNISTPGGANIIQVFVGGKTGAGLGTSTHGTINGSNVPALLSGGFDSWVFYCQTASDGVNADYTIIASRSATPTLSIRDVSGLRTVPVLFSDNVVNITDTGVGVTTVQLPPAARTGESYTIKDGGGSAAANNITIDIIAGGGTIDGAATAVINTNYGSLTFVSDGTNYYVI